MARLVLDIKILFHMNIIEIIIKINYTYDRKIKRNWTKLRL